MKIKLSSDKTQLSDRQKMDIYRCIRFGQLPQDVLLKLSNDPDFALAKELIVQGLAVKFGGADQFTQDELKIVTRKRLA